MTYLSQLIQIDLVYNLAVLVSFTVLSGIVGRQLPDRKGRHAAQGFLFGAAAIVAMMTPMHFVPGVQFDARSVAISVCGAYFGPLSVFIAAGVAAAFRLYLGGAGGLTGILVIAASAVIGLLFHYRAHMAGRHFKRLQLWILGILVHVVMLALMFTLPGGIAFEVLATIAPSVLIFYPAATVILGLILADQRTRRENLRKLSENKEQLSLFLRHSPAAIAMFDTHMRYIVASERWALDYGLGNQDLAGRSHYELFPEIDSDWKAIHQRCLAGASESREEDEFVRSDGRKDWVRWRIEPWYQNSGEVGGIIMFTEVITERKMAELSRRTDERRFRSVFNQQFQYMAILSPEGRILEINDLPLRIVNARKEDVLGKIFWEGPWWRDLPKVQAEWPRCLEKARRSQQPQSGVLENRDASGAIRLANTSVTAIFKDDGTLDYYIVQGSDVTDQHRSQEALLTANRLLEGIFEAMSDAVLVVDVPDRIIVRCNTAMQSIFGYRPEELEGQNTRLLYVSDESYVTIGRASRAAMEEGRTYRAEAGLMRKDGTVVQVEMAVSAISPDADWRRGVVSVIRDITERKESEHALARMAERLSATLESITDAFITLDREWRFTYLNPEAERLLQQSKSNVLGRVAGEIFTDVLKSDINTHLRRAMRERTTVHFESFYAPLDQWFELHAYPSAEGLAVYFRDISERVLAEMELRRVSKRLQDVLDFSPLLITELDTEGRYLLANSAAASLFSRNAEDIVGKVFEDLVPADLAKKFRVRLAEVIQKREALIVEDTVEADGEKTFSTTLFPVINENNEVESVGGIAQDITLQKAADTERKRLELQLRQAQRMESVGRLAGGVAHDFNNMLSVILGHVEMALLAIPDGDPVRNELLEVQSAANRSADLTKQLLAFARRQTIAPRPLDINDLIEKMLSMLGRLLGEDITLEWRPASDLPAIMADPTQIDQIVANLAVNARDAIAGNGTLRIETGFARFDTAWCASHPDHLPGDFVLLSVADNGCGIDEDVAAQIFDPFFTTKPQGQGTGLGLATVYGIVQQNGGFLTVESERGKGACFRLYFPAAKGDATLVQKKKERSQMPEGNETVLLVEDESALLTLSQRMLERLGYTVLATGSPIEAVALATTFDGVIHLLITDVIMPEMNGKELWQELQPLRPGLQTLFMSGYTADVIARHGALDQSVHFLQKPFRIDQLAASVRGALDDTH